MIENTLKTLLIPYRFEKPVTCPIDSILIGSKLDTNTNAKVISTLG